MQYIISYLPLGRMYAGWPFCPSSCSPPLNARKCVGIHGINCRHCPAGSVARRSQPHRRRRRQRRHPVRSCVCVRVKELRDLFAWSGWNAMRVARRMPSTRMHMGAHMHTFSCTALSPSPSPRNESTACSFSRIASRSKSPNADQPWMSSSDSIDLLLARWVLKLASRQSTWYQWCILPELPPGTEIGSHHFGVF